MYFFDNNKEILLQVKTQHIAYYSGTEVLNDLLQSPALGHH